MADATFSGDATVVDGTTAAAGTASADVIGGVYNDSIAALGSGNAGLARLTSARALHVNLRDASGNYVTAGGTQYVEDVALGAVGSATGTLLIGRAATSVPGSVGADADAVGLWALRNGILNVRMVDAAGAAVTPAGGPGTQYAEDSVLGATPTGTLAMARRDDALSTLTPAADDAVGLRVGDKGALWVQISDGSGNQITSFGGGTQFAEDTTLSTDPVGTVAIARGSTAVPTAVNADNDAVGLWATVNGALNVVLRDTTGTAIPAGTQWAADGAMGANPTGTLILGRASTAVPTAMSADGDAVPLWTSRKGSPINAMAPHVGLVGDPWTLVHETAQYSTTQTSAVLVTGAAAETIVVTKVQIQAGGTTSGTMQLYFGTGAYSRGTSRAIFDGEFAPSNTLKPGVVMDGPFIAGAAGDDVLVTTSAAINPLTVTVWYYVVT
jgi:hypothetical protein